MITLPLWALNFWGCVWAHRRAVIYTVIVVVFFVSFALALRSCKPKAKLNEQEIQAAENAIAEKNDAKLKEILAAADAREAQIDTNVSNAEAQTEKAKKEAKRRYENMNTSELAEQLEKRK